MIDRNLQPQNLEKCVLLLGLHLQPPRHTIAVVPHHFVPIVVNWGPHRCSQIGSQIGSVPPIPLLEKSSAPFKLWPTFESWRVGPGGGV